MIHRVVGLSADNVQVLLVVMGCFPLVAEKKILQCLMYDSNEVND